MTYWIEQLLGETRARLLALLRRSQQTITSLADALRLTGNGVRMHIAELRREGVVAVVGMRRDTGGKPARLYGLTPEGEELFPKAYALVLGELVEEIARADGHGRAIALLEAVGRRVAAANVTALGGDARPEDRVAAAATALRGLGADVEVQQTADGWRLQGYGCPLSAVTLSHPDVCALVQAIIGTITGRSVQQCCDRSERPRCAFVVA